MGRKNGSRLHGALKIVACKPLAREQSFWGAHANLQNVVLHCYCYMSKDDNHNYECVELFGGAKSLPRLD